MPRLIGQDINANFFRAYMEKEFGESFAHCSLSFEKEFNASKNEQENLSKFILPENTEFAELIKRTNPELFQTRMKEVIACLKYKVNQPRHIGQIYWEDRYDETGTILIPGLNQYAKYFMGAIRPYRSKPEYEIAKENGLLRNDPQETEFMVDKIEDLIEIIERKNIADLKAKKLKKGNNAAFLYALNLGSLTITDILDINALVNNDAGLDRGYKKVNNQITGASFDTCTKELVPSKMQELLHKYNNEWALELPEYKQGDPEAKKDAYFLAICEREAKFHIEFERIHPFEDGNGRTGRIIMNKQLVDNELGPVLITNEMRTIYLDCIKREDYKTLGNLIYILSSVTTPQIFAAYRRARGIKPDELGMTKTTKK